MTEHTQPVDVRIYGAEPLTPLGVGGAAPAAPAKAYTPPVQVPPATVFNGSPLLAEGAAALQSANRERATMLESAGAAVDQWLTRPIWEAVSTPSFAWDDGFDAVKWMNMNVKFPMDKGDEEFMSKAKSMEDSAHRLDILETRNSAHSAMADNSGTAFFAAVMDPTFFVSAGAGRLAAAARGGRAGALTATPAGQRVVAGSVAGSSMAGMGFTAQQATPMDTSHIILMAAMVGTAEGLFYRPGKPVATGERPAPGRLEPIDPAFPAAQLAEHTKTMSREIDELVGPPRPPALRTPRVPSPLAPHDPAWNLSAAEHASLTKGGRVLTVNTVDDIATHSEAVSSGRAMIEADAKAVYLPDEGRIFLVAKNLKPGDDVKGIMMHEYGVHMNAERVLGTKPFTQMLDDLEGLAASGNARAKQAFDDVPANTPKSLIREEALGYYVERNHGVLKDTFVSRLVAGVREGLRKVGMTNLKLSENDIMQLVRKAARGGSEAGFAGKPATGAVRYSKGLRGTAAVVADTLTNAKKLAKTMEWSWHKSFGKYSDYAKELGDTIFDSPTVRGGNSAASIQRAVRADFGGAQYKYEALLLEDLAENGAGLVQRTMDVASGKAVGVQQTIEKELARELIRQSRAAFDGVPINTTGIRPRLVKMADAVNNVFKVAIAEMKAAGVQGADLVTEMAGYFPRRWDLSKLEAIVAKFHEHGPLPEGFARGKIVDTISIGIQRANGWDAQLASDIAGAIYDRTVRKGLHADDAIRSGTDATGMLRQFLTAEGLTGARLQRVLDVMEGQADAAGKLPTLKPRIDMHMDEALMLPDGSTVTIMDMIDTNIASMTDRYLDTVAGRIAMAKKGMASPTEIAAVRTRLAQSIPDMAKRTEALQSFDEALNVLQGFPVGEQMSKFMRDSQAVTQMVGLSSSGLWQLTEIAPIMAHYGAAATMRQLVKELPFVRNMVKHEAESLRNVLSRNATQDVRLRPFITRMADNYEIPMSDAVSLSLQQGKQLVPYLNGMKYIQKWQANATANLIVDIMRKAANGDAKSIAAVEKYGLESGTMVKVGADIRTHGMDTSKWSHETWMGVRAPLTKMMDESILRARLGETPQFASTSTLGKFMFTFRSFVLAAHNKVLANTLHNQGFAGMSLLLLYQLPLTVLATAANTGLKGKDQDGMEDTIKKALGQVAAFGLFSELFGVMTGNKQQWGSPGTIGIDHIYKLGGAIASGDLGNMAAEGLGAAPLLSIMPGSRAIGETFRNMDESDK